MVELLPAHAPRSTPHDANHAPCSQVCLALNYAMQSEVLPVYANLPQNKILAALVLVFQFVPFVSLAATTVGVSMYLDRGRDADTARNVGVPLIIVGVFGLLATFVGAGYVFQRCRSIPASAPKCCLVC